MTGVPLTLDEARSILKRERKRDWLIPILAVTLVFVMVAFGIVAGVLIASTNRGEANADRGDCSRAYSSLLTEKKDAVNFLDVEQNATLNNALLGSTTGVRTSPETIALFQKNQDVLNRLLAEARKLPTLNDAVNKGFTLDRMKHPPCPG